MIIVSLLICIPSLMIAGEQGWMYNGTRLAQSNSEQAQVFIAHQSGKFKDALLENVTDVFDAQTVSYVVAEVSALKKIDEDEYDAVVIIQYVKAGRINSNVRRYLDKTKRMDRIVLVTTSGSGKVNTDAWDVDGISTASEMSDLDKITQKVLSRLEQILGVQLPT
jgi:hypothetical protein